ncbi:CBS domain-containing protein [Furfurilactobacillus siliginis]|uniref:Transcriptional regulator, CBS domain n=1 Tax=Furfurilactobacillus siliginis TaxID=348151 RepID=A0A0R2L739_9LACO|nr:helix-turn-helix transcriptional regulator [Furfurilactobacillus siliginis]KRN94701.1 transcriptional regulator, CBS domain [Furfurilactobacillus siliginis]GEK28413.1 hypothetical protein LSI01_07240 [Furfurilactobacillus siliginis]
MDFTKRQQTIIKILKQTSPLTAEAIAERLQMGIPTIRTDLRLLTAVGQLTSRPKVGYAYAETATNIDHQHLYEESITDILLPPTEIQPDTPLQQAVNTLFMADVGSLYVVDKDHNLRGLISRKDLLRASINNNDLEATPASMVMTRVPNIVTVTPDTSILHVGDLLLQHQVDSLPVVSASDSWHVIGKITKNRLFQRFIELGRLS